MSGIDLIGTLQPKNSGAFPTHDAQYGKGGFQSVADLTARNAIPNLNRVEGMQVYVVANGQTYSLASGLTNADWYSVTGATPQSITWRPGETSKNGQVATWAEVEVWIAASIQPAPLLVYVDDSIATPSVPLTADTDCLGFLWFVASNPITYSGTTYVEIANGGRLRNLAGLDGVSLYGSPTSVIPITWDYSAFFFLQGNAWLDLETGATVALVEVQHTLSIDCIGNTAFINFVSPTYPIIKINAAQILTLTRRHQSQTISLVAGTVGGAVGTTLNFASIDAAPYTAQPLMLGTVNLTRLSKANASDPSRGSTANRPAAPFTGEMYFDTDGYAAIWWDGANWINTPTASSISAFDIDWSLKAVFTKTLSAGANTFTFSNATSGKIIVVRVTGAASTLTWPTVKWAGGTPPTQTASGTDIYTFIHDGTDIFGSAVQDMS